MNKVLVSPRTLIWACRRLVEQDVHITGIQLFAGKQELISTGTLVLTYGTHYGLIGRNGVGKSSLLRAIGETKA